MKARMKAKRTRRHGDTKNRTKNTWGRLTLLSALVLVVTCGCALKAGRSGVPPEVESVVTTTSDDIAEGRYEKIYNEADDQWRNDSTLEQTSAVFSTLKNKLGNVKSRQLHAASELTRYFANSQRPLRSTSVKVSMPSPRSNFVS